MFILAQKPAFANLATRASYKCGHWKEKTVGLDCSGTVSRLLAMLKTGFE